MAVYSVMQLLSTSVWGRLSDRIGRRPMIGIIGLALSFFLMAVSSYTFYNNFISIQKKMLS